MSLNDRQFHASREWAAKARQDPYSEEHWILPDDEHSRSKTYDTRAGGTRSRFRAHEEPFVRSAVEIHHAPAGTFERAFGTPKPDRSTLWDDRGSSTVEDRCLDHGFKRIMALKQQGHDVRHFIHSDYENGRCPEDHDY